MKEEMVLESKRDLSVDENQMFDVVIIGSGPAGMSASICAKRANLNVLLIEKILPGGECSTACKIDNYIGFSGGILGDDLSNKMEAQLLEYQVHYTCESVVDILDSSQKTKVVKTNLGKLYKTKTVILCIGLEPKRWNPSIEQFFLGRGVSYYAKGDAEYHKGKDVLVIGGGNCACYAADYLADLVERVYMVHDSSQLKAVPSLRDKIQKNPKIDMMWDARVTEVFGIDKVERAKIVSTINDQHAWLTISGIFPYVGRIPPNEIILPEVEVDESGFIVTDDYMRTNIKGIYAAGDIRSKQVRQIATSVSDGMIAAINIERDFFR